MIQPRLSHALPFGLLLALAGCPSDDDGPSVTSAAGTDTDPTTSDPTTNDPTTNDPTTNDPTTDSADSTVGPDTDGDTDTDGETEGPELSFCERLGEASGIGDVVDTALGGVLTDPRINGYFLNDTVDGGHVRDCLVIQLAALAECEGYEYPTDECRPMDESHEGLGISQNDFDDLAGHFADALEDARVSRDDISTVMGALAGMADDIVEDETNNATRYQRLGRKPGIQNLLGEFVTLLGDEPALAAFFFDFTDPLDPQPTVDIDRLLTCFTRQLCGEVLGGPCSYGGEVDAPEIEPGVASDNQCQDMLTAHTGVVSNVTGLGISVNDFNDFIDVMDDALDVAFPMGSAADKANIIVALDDMSGDIIAP